MQEEEQSQHDPASDEDQIEIAGYDCLEWFQNSIVVVDTKGKPERRIIGEMLDPSDTTILSVRVNDLKMAEEIFLSWVAPGKEAILVHLSPEANERGTNGQPKKYIDYNTYKQCASLPEVEKVLKYHTEHYEFREAMIDYMEDVDVESHFKYRYIYVRTYPPYIE